MLSDDAKRVLARRQALAHLLEDPSLSAGLRATAADSLAGLTDYGLDDLVTEQASEPHRTNKEAVSEDIRNDTVPVETKGPAEDDLVSGDPSVFSASDLRKQGRKGLSSKQDWSLRMINEGLSLPDLLLDNTVTDGEFARAAAANLQTKFPDVDLNKYKWLTKDVRDKWITNWRTVILGCSVYYRHFKRFPTAEQIHEYFGASIDYENIQRYLGDKNTNAALEELGVSSPTAGLSEKQLLALSLLSSFNDARPLNAKLKSIGVNNWEFNNWLGYPKFQAAYRKITEDLLSEVQPVINTALVQLATGAFPGGTGKPDLSSIKYLNEMNGRWDPQTRQVMDMRSFMTKVVDILTQELADDPARLQRIGARLVESAGSGGSGASGNPHGASIEGSSEGIGQVIELAPSPQEDIN